MQTYHWYVGVGIAWARLVVGEETALESGKVGAGWLLLCRLLLLLLLRWRLRRRLRWRGFVGDVQGLECEESRSRLINT